MPNAPRLKNKAIAAACARRRQGSGNKAAGEDSVGGAGQMNMGRRIPAPLPPSVDAFEKRCKNFEAWLLEHGSSVKQPTNPYEVIRFTGLRNECVVYRKANGTISHWANGADQAYRAFLDGTAWRGAGRGTRDQKTANLILSLAGRDGWCCCYCCMPLDMETATIEHFVPVTSGGTSHMANLSLGCAPCNKEAGHLPVRAKVELAIRKRSTSDADTN